MAKDNKKSDSDYKWSSLTKAVLIALAVVFAAMLLFVYVMGNSYFWTIFLLILLVGVLAGLLAWCVFAIRDLRRETEALRDQIGDLKWAAEP